MGLIIADTNVIIYSIKGLKETEPYVRGFDFAIAEVSIIELLGVKGIDDFTLRKREEFIGDCIILNYNSYIREIAIRLKQKYTFRIPDALIAATSMHYDIPLVTADKEFKKIDELEVIIINF
jgi:predicted nucleic acid-binding protein